MLLSWCFFLFVWFYKKNNMLFKLQVNLSTWQRRTQTKGRSQVLAQWKYAGRRAWPRALRARPWPASSRSCPFSQRQTPCPCRRERMVRQCVTRTFCSLVITFNPSIPLFSSGRAGNPWPGSGNWVFQDIVSARFCESNLNHIYFTKPLTFSLDSHMYWV